MASADFDIETLDKLEAAIRADPERLFRLTEEQRVQAAIAIMAEKNRLYKRDIWRWLTECVTTIDEASHEQARWPNKPYLRELLEVIDANQMIAVPKSRRMLVSWALAAYCVHRARFFEGNAIFVQSETEDKSAYIVGQRCAYIEDNLPEPYRRKYSTIKTTKGLVGRMTYKTTGSYIWGIPQGGDVLRTYTPTILFMDEADFMPEAHQALTAALPAVEKNAKLILVTSSNGPSGVVAGMCKEIGLTSWAAVA